MDNLTPPVKPNEINVSRNALSVARVLDRVAATNLQGAAVVIVTITPDKVWTVAVNNQTRIIDMSRTP